jgi:hypothetical protein
MPFNYKHANQTIKHNDQTKTKLSPQSPQWSSHSVAHVWRRGNRPPFSRKMEMGLSGKYRETRNSYLVSVKYGLEVAT